VLIEACEESGSYDLPHYVDALASRIGTPSLVVCLDSGCSDYEHLWTTTSLRGIVNGVLTVEVLTEGVHSGAASGIVPSSFRILRALLSRIEDEQTGEVRLRDLHADIPRERVDQARAVADVLAKRLAQFPFVPGMRPMHDDPLQALLAGTWKPALSTTGAAGLPSPRDGGNVLRPQTAAKLSMRLPPTVSAAHAARRLKDALEADPPYGARVYFEVEAPGDGWDAPPTAPWLAHAMRAASEAYFGQPAMAQGTGGSIPFMAMLGARYPQAQFMITGVLGPDSNAHGPNEYLHVPTGVRVTASVASVLTAHAQRAR
jgi:acetylornithine deacetylase/succinyl-diaminopimelate desuccinylase-like protein